jgi:DNA-directed RNA polymerase specialized sigma24 family protein
VLRLLPQTGAAAATRPRRKTSPAAGTPPEITPIIEALGQLDFIVRAEFLLKVDWALRVEDVAALLDRSVDMIRRDVATARELLRPHIEQGTRALTISKS